MYRELKAEIVRKGFSISSLAEAVGITQPSLSKKLNGSTKFTLDEVFAIKAALKSDMPIEELFARAEA